MSSPSCRTQTHGVGQPLRLQLGADRCQMHFYQETGKSQPWGEPSAEFTQVKQAEKWLYDFDSQMMQPALTDLQRAYVNRFGKRAKFPKF